MSETVTTDEFRTRWMDLFDRVASGQVESVIVTRAGRPIARVLPPDEQTLRPPLYGFMRGSVTVPDGLDLTEPAFDGTLNAAEGKLLG